VLIKCFELYLKIHYVPLSKHTPPRL